MVGVLKSVINSQTDSRTIVAQLDQIKGVSKESKESRGERGERGRERERDNSE